MTELTINDYISRAGSAEGFMTKTEREMELERSGLNRLKESLFGVRLLGRRTSVILSQKKLSQILLDIGMAESLDEGMQIAPLFLEGQSYESRYVLKDKHHGSGKGSYDTGKYLFFERVSDEIGNSRYRIKILKVWRWEIL